MLDGRCFDVVYSILSHYCLHSSQFSVWILWILSLRIMRIFTPITWNTSVKAPNEVASNVSTGTVLCSPYISREFSLNYQSIFVVLNWFWYWLHGRNSVSSNSVPLILLYANCYLIFPGEPAFLLPLDILHWSNKMI